MPNVPTYPYLYLKELVPSMSMTNIRDVSFILRNERDLYSIDDYINCLIIISNRIITVSNDLTGQG
jgi:hypothetical protein